MAFTPTLTFCLSNSCTELSVSETTGVYNVTTNPGGYGTPNPATGDVSSYVLVITDPDDVEYTIDLFANGFPTTNSDFEYSIPLTSLGNRTVIEDGYWQFAWTVVSTGPVTSTGNSAYYFTCNTECCVAALLANIVLEDNGCNCNDDATAKQMDYLRAKAFLESLKNAAFCGKLTLFNNIKTAINKMCAKTDCKTCN